MPATPVISTEPSPTTVPSIAFATASSVTFMVAPLESVRAPPRGSLLGSPRSSRSRGRHPARVFLPELVQNPVRKVERLVAENDVAVRRVHDDRVTFA